MKAYIYIKDTDAYEMLNIVVLACNEAQADQFLDEHIKDWEAKPKMLLISEKDLKPGVLDVSYYIE